MFQQTRKEMLLHRYFNYAKNNSKNYNESDALLDVDRVLENVKMDPVTKSPVFKFESKSALYDGVTQEINISKAQANKFDPQDLITDKGISKHLEIIW